MSTLTAANYAANMSAYFSAHFPAFTAAYHSAFIAAYSTTVGSSYFAALIVSFKPINSANFSTVISTFVDSFIKTFDCKAHSNDSEKTTFILPLDTAFHFTDWTAHDRAILGAFDGTFESTHQTTER